MLINESGLVKAIKDAHRHGGYTVLNKGDEFIVYANSGDWLVKCERNIFPKKALAVIVEHIGDIPSEFEPTMIAKKEEPQIMMRTAVERDVNEWTIGEAVAEVTITAVIMQGLQVFQEKQGGKCWGIDLLSLGMIERGIAETKPAVAMNRNRLAFSVGNEAVVVKVARKAEADWPTEWERVVWMALESVDLHRGEA